MNPALAESPALTPGRLFYLLYYYPLAEIRRSFRAGGPWQQWLDARGRAAMHRAAHHLPPITVYQENALELHQLTGRRYLTQSIFCLWTFARASGQPVAPVFYDDGSLLPHQLHTLRRIFPLGRIVAPEQTLARLELLLPAYRFPALRERFARYPHIRKLIAVHLGARGWKLTLDADLLFFRRPDFLLHWMQNARRPLHLLDVADAYGYSPGLLQKLAGKMPSHVNSGLIGLRSDTIDWHQLESWCATLLREEGSHYLLEQCLTAMLLAGQECAIPPLDDYLTLPWPGEIEQPRAVMHHYVDESKRGYFRVAWRRAVAHFGAR